MVMCLIGLAMHSTAHAEDVGLMWVGSSTTVLWAGLCLRIKAHRDEPQACFAARTIVDEKPETRHCDLNQFEREGGGEGRQCTKMLQRHRDGRAKNQRKAGSARQLSPESSVQHVDAAGATGW